MDFRNDLSLVKSMLFICEFALEMIAEFKLLLALSEEEVLHTKSTLFPSFLHDGS